MSKDSPFWDLEQKGTELNSVKKMLFFYVIHLFSLFLNGLEGVCKDFIFHFMVRNEIPSVFNFQQNTVV